MLNPSNYPTQPSRLRSSNPAEDISGFFKLVSDAMNAHIKLNGGPEGIVPILVESSPKERLQQPDKPFEVITFRVQESRMAPMSNDGSRIPRSISVREVRSDTDKANYSIIESAWVEEAHVVFEIWSRTNSNANKLVEWFHKFIYIWANTTEVFAMRGISQFKFEKRLADQRVDGVSDEEVYLRELMYSFRFENLVRFEKRQLTDISLNIDYPADAASINLTSDSQ